MDQEQNGMTSEAQDALFASGKAAQQDFVRKITDKIKESENILVALSKDPSIDEISAAVALATFLDGIQKHVTAIYSGKIPSSLEFLRPEATFEANVDSLQDFIISLDKDKADHLRYKLDGDFVRVFITPYRTTISEKDLTFTHGDYNVNFVVAVNVPSAADLDPALGDHAVMRNAETVNITRGEAGKFGEIEWSNPAASSVCEMMTQLIFSIQGQDATLDRDVATALLTGIVAATDRFSNDRTSSDTLGLASKLMTMGADQQLISSHVVGNKFEQGESAESDESAENVESGEGGSEVAKENAAANPAAQAAQAMPSAPAGPAPATFTIPNMTPAPTVVPPDVQAQSSSGVIVQPIVPVAEGEQPPAMTVSGKPVEEPKPRERMTDAKIATTPGMLTGEETPGSDSATGAAPAAPVAPVRATMPDPATMVIPGMPNVEPTPTITQKAPTMAPTGVTGSKDYGQMIDNALAGQNDEGGVVSKPAGAPVLPPPPVPPAPGPDMMPPKLPPVQV